MAEPLVLKISIDKGNAVIDVQQVATALKALDDQEKKTGEGATGMEDDYKKFFKEQRTGDRILNESKSAVMGLSSAYVLLSGSMGGSSAGGKMVETSLTTLVMGAQASEFALFSVTKGMNAMGGTAQIVGAKIQASMGWITLTLGALLALGTAWNEYGNRTKKIAEETKQSMQTMREGLQKELEGFKGDKRLRIEFEITSAKEQLSALRTQLMNLYKSGADSDNEQVKATKQLITSYETRLAVAIQVGTTEEKNSKTASASTERTLELERSKVDAMKDGHDKKVALIQQDSKEEENALRQRINNGQEDAITQEQFLKLDIDRKNRREQRLREEFEFEKQKWAEKQSKYADHLNTLRELDEQYALALTHTDEEERLLRKKQLQDRIQEFEMLYGPPTMEQLERYKRFKLQLAQMESSEERKTAQDIYEMKKTLREFQIEDIETDLGRELAMIDEKYNEEVRLAEGNAEKIQLIEQRKSAEVERAHKKSVDEYTELEDKLGRELTKKEQKLAAKIDPIANMLSSNVSSAWASIIDSSQTGAEKWANIMEGMKQTAWSAIGAIVDRWVKGQLTMFLFNLLNPVGALTGKTIDSGVSGFGTNLAMTAPNVGMYSGS